MSDGDSATPGRRRLPDPEPAVGDDNQWLTRFQRSAPGAAPWERGSSSAGSEPPEPKPAQVHTGIVTVADLIAKVAGDGSGPIRSSRATRRRGTEPEPEDCAQPATEDPDTDVIAIAPSHASELPDLALAHRPGRVAPVRIGDDGGSGPPLATPAAAPARPHPARRTAIVAGRAIAALTAVLALVLTGGAWQWTSQKNNNFNKVAALDPDSRDIVDPNAQFGDENFLIVGVDSRAGQNADMGAGNTSDAAGARSDSVILVNIPASRERVVAVSFPRDLAITPIKCQAWDPNSGKYGPVFDPETETYGPDQVYTETKLNSAYSFGGPKCLVKVIQKISGLSINRFMAIDFAGFAKMVDALGGVEVCSTTPLEDYELGTVLAKAGRQTIDGHTALNYVRARQVTTEINGDYGRIKRQQMFLSSLLRSLISKNTFFSLHKLNDVVNMFISDSHVDNITTKDLVDLGQSIQGVAAGRITFVTLPTTGITDEYGNEVPATDAIHGLFDAIINDDSLPGETNANTTTAARATHGSAITAAPPAALASTPTGEVVDAVTTDPSEVTVRVSNSTGAGGLAATATTELRQHGFHVASPDDYPDGSLTSTTVFFSAGNEQAAATVASSFANPTIERVSGMGEVVQVVLGSDFHSVSPPSPSGSPVQVHVVRGAGSQPTELPEDLAVTNAADTTCG